MNDSCACELVLHCYSPLCEVGVLTRAQFSPRAIKLDSDVVISCSSSPLPGNVTQFWASTGIPTYSLLYPAEESAYTPSLLQAAHRRCRFRCILCEQRVDTTDDAAHGGKQPQNTTAATPFEERSKLWQRSWIGPVTGMTDGIRAFPVLMRQHAANFSGRFLFVLAGTLCRRLKGGLFLAKPGLRMFIASTTRRSWLSKPIARPFLAAIQRRPQEYVQRLGCPGVHPKRLALTGRG